jgi:hypothetical protein
VFRTSDGDGGGWFVTVKVTATEAETFDVDGAEMVTDPV